MRTLLLTLISTFIIGGLSLHAQVTVSGGTSAAGSYPTLTAAINALNTGGALTAPVVVDVNAGFTETLTGRINLTMTGDVTNTITIQKSGSGANPVLTSYTGTNLANTATFDGMFALIGSDYVTIDGIDLQEAAANTTATTTMEYGFGLFKASATDGANNNIIRNCTITLNRVNSTTTVNFPFHGSNGIIVVPCTPTAMTTAITVTAISGASSNNKFYSNTLQNLNTGISLCGFGGPSPFDLCDTGNDVGGTSAATGNTIINFGGGTGATVACAAVYTREQWSTNISFNTVDNNVGGTGGVNHPNTNRGIFTSASSIGASADINNNNVTIRGGASTSAIDWTIDCEMAQSGANGNTININNNTLSVEKTVASTVALTAIWFNSAPTTANINNNIVTKFAINSTSTADCGPIRCALAPGTLNINNNNISGVIFNNTTGTNFIISSTSAVTSAVNINNNIINGVSAPLATSKILNIITRNAAANTANASISGNSFSNITRIGTGAVTFITATGTPLNQTIDANTFNNLTINTTGTVTFIAHSYTVPPGGTQIISNNQIVTGFSKTGAGGSVVCMTSGSSSIAALNISHINNNWSNITVTGATAITGINNTDGLSTTTVNRTVSGNQFTNWTGGTSAMIGMTYAYWGGTTSTLSNNTIQNLSGQGAITGINLTASGNTANPLTISNNVVSNLTSSGTGGNILGIACSNTSPIINLNGNTIHSLSSTGTTVTGINITGALLTHVFQNKVYNLQSANSNPAVNGIAVGGGTTVNVHNNIVGDLRTPNANAANPLNGINVTGGTNVNLFYNTVHLNASSSGALFGSSAVSVSSTPTATLRNNIFVNNSISNGTGLAVAHRRSTATLTSYSTSSDNNLFFGPSLFTDGTNTYANYAAYKVAMATRDQASFYENPTFLNTTSGAGTDFLHLDPALGTQAESGGVAITGYDTDFDGDIRQGSAGYAGSGLAPDLGADEGGFTFADLTAPVITFVTPQGNACGSVSRTISATITDASGVPITGVLMPRIYFRKNAGAFSSAAGSLSSGNAKNGVWNFTINYAAIGGVALSDVIEYYIIAQDISGLANISSFPTGAVATDVNNVTASPAGLTYIQSTFLSGTFTVGLGGFFPTLTAAVEAYNGSCMGGPIVFQLTDALYTDTVRISRNDDASAVNTLTIYPVNAGTVISGTTFVNPTIDMNGARFVYIDGRPGGTGGFTPGVNMVINNAGLTRSAVRFINDASNNILRYCDVQSNNSTTAASTAGVILFSTTTAQNGNDNNTITFCDVHNITGGNPVVAINSNGSTTTVAQGNDNNIVTDCNISDYFHATSASAGILIQSGNSAWTIQNNKFYQTAARTITGTAANRDIFLNSPSATSSGSGYLITGNNFGGDNPSGSGMYALTGTTAHTYASIFTNVGVGTPTSIQNNTFNNISFTSGSTSASAMSCITNGGGNVDIGTVTGNVIGLANTDASLTPAISYTNSSTTTGGFIPIFANCATNATLSTTNVSNNIISGIAIASTLANNAAEFNGIGYNNGVVTISNNMIGSTATPKSIYCSSSSSTTNTNASRFVGILVSAGALSSRNITLTGNTIANMWTNYANPGAPATTGARGILALGTATGNLTTTISNNIIRDITTFSATTTGNPNSAAGGIAISTGSMATCDVLNNTIYNINNLGSAVTGAVQVTGIFFGATTTAPANINNNNIHSLGLSAINPAAFITGMDIGTGNMTIANNLIRLGIDGTGADITAPCTVRGITKNAGTSRIYHNSIYIGGQNVGTSTSNTFALVRTGTAVDDWRNNILVNNRSNGSTGGKHYAINLNAITTLTLDYNDYFGNGAGYVFGSTAGADVATYAAGWVAGDNNSFNIDPQLINPTGDASNVNLHLSPTLATIAEGTGTPIATITTDFDGETRSGLTPTDLGADAGNFVSLYCSGTPATPTAVINGNAATICISGTKNLGLTGYSSVPGLTLQWKESAIAGGPYTNVSGGTGATTSGYTTATLTATTYYVCELTCSNGGATALSSEVEVKVTNPTIMGVIQGSRCGTGTVNLSATPSVGAEIQWFSALTGGNPIGYGNNYTTPAISATTNYFAAAINIANNANVTQGLGATTSATYSNPFYSLWSNIHTQHLITAAELSASGMVAGDINSVALDITVAGTLPMIDLSLKIGTTAATSMSTFVSNAGFSSVYSNASLLPIVGLNVLNFSAPFYWDGVSNLVLEFCHGNPSSTATMSRTAKADNTSYISTIKTNNTVATAGSIICGNTTSNVLTYSVRPQFIFNAKGKFCESTRTPVVATVSTAPGMSVSPDVTICSNGTGTPLTATSPDPNYTYSWDPGVGLSNTTGATVTANPPTTTIYSVTGTNTSTGCADVASTKVTVNQVPISIDIKASTDTVCFSDNVTLSLINGNPSAPSGLDYQWQSSSNGSSFTNIAGATSATYTGLINQTNDRFFQCNLTCLSNPGVVSSSKEIFINAPSVLSTSPGTRCGAGTVDLSATAGNPSEILNWFAAATGGLSLGSGNTFTTPVISNTTTYYVSSGTGGNNGNFGLANRVGSTTNTGYSDVGLMFDAFVPFTLQSVSIYPIGTGANASVTIALRNSAGTTLQSVTISVPTAASPGVKTLVPLNFAVPAGTAHRLVFTAASGLTGVIREATTGYTYPYTLPGVASITSAYTGGPSASFYYYFYDWVAIVGCSSARVPVAATITPSPAFTVTAGQAICNDGIKALTVTSNLPDYDNYTWSATTNLYTNPAATNAYTGGTANTVYFRSTTPGNEVINASAFNSSNQCANIAALTMNVLPVPTVKPVPDVICVSGVSSLSLSPATGYSGASFQWSDSNDGVTYTPISAANSSTYNSPTLTSTKFYQLQLSDGSGTICAQPFDTVLVSNPLIASVSPGSRCGTGTVTLGATPVLAGGNVDWFTSATGGSPVGTGTSFTTPSISSTTTYYASTSQSGVGSSGGSPILITELDLGSNDKLEIQNVSPASVDVTGWKVYISDSYTVFTSVNANVQTLSGIWAPGQLLSFTDATAGPNYWGSNMFWNPGAFPSFSGWAAIVDNTNTLRDVVVLNWPATNINTAVTLGGLPYNFSSIWTGAGIDITTVAATQSVSRKGTIDNNNNADFEIVNLSINVNNTNLTLPMNGFACSGTRVPVVATVISCPRVSAKVLLSHADAATGLMSDYVKTLSNFPTSDPYAVPGAYNGAFAHLNSGPVATVSPAVLAVTGNNAIVDWVFLELRQGSAGASVVTHTKVGLLQRDGDIVGTDGVSPIQFEAQPGNYYVAVRHRNHLGFRTLNTFALSNSPTTLNFTNNSIALNGAYPMNNASATVYVMVAGDANSDGSVDSIDTITWEQENGLFDDYILNSDYNLDGSIDAIDSISWETNNGKYQELD